MSAVTHSCPCHRHASLSPNCVPMASCCFLPQMTTLTGRLPQAPGWLTSSHPGQFVRPATNTDRQPGSTVHQHPGTASVCLCVAGLCGGTATCSCLTDCQHCVHAASLPLVCAGAPTVSRWSQLGKPSQQHSSHTTSKWQRCVRHSLTLPKTEPKQPPQSSSLLNCCLTKQHKTYRVASVGLQQGQLDSVSGVPGSTDV